MNATNHLFKNEKETSSGPYRHLKSQESPEQMETAHEEQKPQWLVDHEASQKRV